MSDTPITNAAELDDSHFADWGTGPSGYVRVNEMRKLERSLQSAEAAKRELVEFVTGKVVCCYACGGTGVWHMMLDETEFGQPPGSNTRPCQICENARAPSPVAQAERTMEGEGKA